MRNPGKERNEIEAELMDLLGLENVVWVDVAIEGDDTDGHVDNFARFVSHDAIVVTQQGLNANPHLHDLGCEIGILPEPADEVVVDGKTCPASYANFYIANDQVIVPQFGDAADEEATAMLGTCFPGRRMTGIDSRELLWGHGGFHCITQQVPRIPAS